MRPSTVVSRFIFGLLLAALIISYLVYRTGIRSLVASMRQVDLPLLCVALVILNLEMYLKARRWATTIQASIHRPVKGALSASLIGFAGNMVMPARIGELARTVVFARRNVLARSLVLTTVGVTQLLDLLMLAVYFLVVSFWVTSEFLVDRTMIVVSLGGTVGVLLVLLIIRRSRWSLRGIIRFAGRLLSQSMQGRLEDYMQQFADGLRLLGDQRRVASVLLYTLLIWMLDTAMFALALMAFNVPIVGLMPALLVVVLNLAFAVPMTPGNVGAHQFLCVMALGVFGVSEVDALSFSIGFQGVCTVMVVSLGGVCLYREGLGLGFLYRESRTSGDATGP